MTIRIVGVVNWVLRDIGKRHFVKGSGLYKVWVGCNSSMSEYVYLAPETEVERVDPSFDKGRFFAFRIITGMHAGKTVYLTREQLMPKLDLIRAKVSAWGYLRPA